MQIKDTLINLKRFEIVKFILLLITSLAVFTINLIIQSKGTHVISGYKLLPYELSYQELGFIKRALWGSIAGALSVDKHKLAFAINFTAIIILTAFASYFLTKFMYKLDRTQWRILAALTILSPFTYLQFGYDFGRQDLVNFALLAVGLLFINKHWISLAALIQVLALLTHEAYLFYGLPLTIAYYLYLNQQYRWQKKIIKGLPLFFSAIATLTLLFVYGKYELGLDVLLEKVNTTQKESLIIWTSSITDNIIYTIQDKFFVKPSKLLERTVIYGSYILAIAFFLRNFLILNNIKDRLLVWVPFAVAPLYILGVDYSRWLMFSYMNMLFILYIFILEGKARVVSKVDKLSAFYIFIFCLFILGAIGVTSPFPNTFVHIHERYPFK